MQFYCHVTLPYSQLENLQEYLVLDLKKSLFPVAPFSTKKIE